MYTIRISCSCGATFEMDFDLNVTFMTESMYQHFLKTHKDCCMHIHSNSGDPLAADPNILNRLDEMNPNI